MFNQFGDLERCALRPGNVHSADGWRDVLEPVLARYRHTMQRRYFRGDAAFANPEVYELLEMEGYKYTIRLPANSVLQERIAWLLTRPVGRPANEVRRHYASFSYEAGSWNKARTRSPQCCLLSQRLEGFGGSVRRGRCQPLRLRRTPAGLRLQFRYYRRGPPGAGHPLRDYG